MDTENNQTGPQSDQIPNPQINQVNHDYHKQMMRKYKLIFPALIICLIISFLILIFLSFINKKLPLNNQTAGIAPISKIKTTAFSDQPVTTNEELLSLGSQKNNLNNLPLGDEKYTTQAPQKGYIYLCDVMNGGGGAQENGSWINKTTWSLPDKPSVQGSINWPDAVFSEAKTNNQRIFSGNGLPLNTPTGIFPIRSTDPAYQFDRNPNSIQTHQFSLTLLRNPVYSSIPSCMGGEVGIMLNGVPLFNGFDAENRDAPAHEVQDSCDGHPQESGEYHYHSLSRCIKDIKETSVIGYALDGFPITGPLLSNGKYLSTNDLDECHGITSQIQIDGKNTITYHYVMTYDFPYSVSCFRAKPVSLQIIKTAANQLNRTNLTVGQNKTFQQPPQQATEACSGKLANSQCSFDTPGGSVNGTCQSPPNQSQLVCVPQGR